MNSAANSGRLTSELAELFDQLTKMRRELAQLFQDEKASFHAMADTLDAIVENTEAAGNNILENMEQIEAMIGEIRQSGDAGTQEICARINDHINQVFEACSFQDLTGQRVTRVARSLQFVEQRVNAIVALWGQEALSLEEQNPMTALVNKDEGLLHGPQRPSVAISQADIDKLFD